MAGRITLVKSVLTAIPTYQLAFAIDPKTTVRSLKSLLCSFLWGGGGADALNAIPWIKWDELCVNTKEGGLGFTNLECFNLALVGKWLWRYLEGHGNLWARIIRSCYGQVEWGDEGLSFTGHGRGRTGWWSKILSIGLGPNGKWFRDNLSRKIGCGADIKFWHHKWVGSASLKSLFPRLFNLSINRESFISDMGVWENGVWSWKMVWRRNLFDWEAEAVNQLLSLISNVNLSAGTNDGWTWEASPNGIYSTKTAYSKLLSSRTEARANIETSYLMNLIWKAAAPRKAIVTAWRLLRNRLPTCDNLSRRNVPLSEAELKCTACGQLNESANHLFLQCKKASELWNNIQQWIGISSVRPFSQEAHFLMFSHLGNDKRVKSFLKSLWICTTWILWKWRNDCRFGRISWDNSKIVLEIKARMWSWCKSLRIPVAVSNFYSWCSQDVIKLLL